MEDKKDCIIINYTGRTGAGALDALEMAKALVGIGQCVIPIISSGVDNLSMWKDVGFERLIVVDTYRSISSMLFNTVAFPLRQRRKIKRELKDYCVRMVYVPIVTYWSSMVNKIFKMNKIVMVKHDPVPHSGEFFLDPQRFFNPYKYADIIIVHSKRFIDIAKKSGKAVEYFPLGPHNMYRFVENKSVIVTYDPKIINFVFFGRIEKYKGLDVLAKAYGSLCEKYGDKISLTVVGSGDFSPYEKDYENLSNVKIINRWIKDEETESIFIGKNLISVCPYKDATQSGVVLVSYEYGVPVIATNTGGLPEQVFDGKTGFLVEPGNAVELADAMKKYIIDDRLIDSQQKCIKDYLESISWESSAKKLVSLIDPEYKS